MHQLVHGQLIPLQVQTGEEPVFAKQIVTDQRIGGQDVADHCVLLAVATEQEEDLRLKRIARAVVVKAGQERILFEHLQQQPATQLLL